MRIPTSHQDRGHGGRDPLFLLSTEKLTGPYSASASSFFLAAPIWASLAALTSGYFRSSAWMVAVMILATRARLTHL